MPRRVRAPCGRWRLGSRRPRVGRCWPPESGCSGMQPQAGGKPHPRLNTGERPIANKYREGKMKRTLRRESKALEIAGREALGARRFGPARMPGSGWRGGRVFRGAPHGAFGGFSLVSLRCPVHPGGTASVGSVGGRGAGFGSGRRFRPSAADRLAGRRLRGRGRARPAPFGAGGGSPGGQGGGGGREPGARSLTDISDVHFP